MSPSNKQRIAAATAATLAGSIIGHAAAQSGPYTVSDSTTTRTYTVTQGELHLIGLYHLTFDALFLSMLIILSTQTPAAIFHSLQNTFNGPICRTMQTAAMVRSFTPLSFSRSSYLSALIFLPRNKYPRLRHKCCAVSRGRHARAQSRDWPKASIRRSRRAGHHHPNQSQHLNGVQMS